MFCIHKQPVSQLDLLTSWFRLGTKSLKASFGRKLDSLGREDLQLGPQAFCRA